MALQDELNLREASAPAAREMLLNVVHTATVIRKAGSDFLRQFGLTVVQFNVLMLLEHQRGGEPGLSQARLSEMMLVNRANMTTLIDRMEEAGLVQRTARPTDRRYNIIALTTKGEELLGKVEPLYLEEIRRRTAAFGPDQQRQLIRLLEQLRQQIQQG